MKFKNILNEGNALIRVFNVVQSKDLCMAILTASRNNKSESENDKNNKELRKTLRNYGFGYREVQGHYPEQLEDGSRVDHIDDSSLVTCNAENEELLLKLSLKLCKDYEQDSILFKHCDGNVFLYREDGTVEAKLGQFRPDKVSDYMSKLKNGRSFVFESVSEWQNGFANSYLSALARKERIKNLLG